MTVKDRKSQLVLTVFLGILAALAPLSIDMYLPSLPLMPEEFGVTTSVIQLTLTMTMAGMAIGQIFAGPISDMKGRRMPLVIGMLIFAISTLVCIFATSIYVFLIFRFIQGLAGAVGIVIARAIARDVCEGPQLTKLFSMLMLVNGLAPILAPVIGGEILIFTSWRGIFVLLMLIGLMLTMAALLFKESLRPENRISGWGSTFKSFRALITNKYFLGHCLMQCFSFAAFFSYISGSSFIFQNIYGVSAQEYSLIFGGIGIAIAITGVIPMRLAGRVADENLLRWSLVQSFVGSLLIFTACWFNAPLALLILSLLVVIPMIAIMGATSFSLAMRAHGKNAGSASALIGFFSMISGSIMAPLVGIAGSANPMPMAVIMLIGEAGALLFFYVMIMPSHKKVPVTE
ncbi:MFS transporter, DHA1 family, bicyclomycin/chloramphenicol resistance protein [Propionispira arboris]|uniref:Bcr/CflA family efflux transporter n=1 Tax=Propionispira arboris TaxID=84035 RepID=A0A1H6VAZ2_9FIRM|nr:multidrug effflux MFS transporter [Propionispira arboris]SEI97452.1 MFS transporter, DHA1 family, bicyclomycin/chloramphenicol resistance protein [Propionispira arboris]